MADLRLNDDGDLYITEHGDIELTDSICQAVLIRLRWIETEWRLGPELGVPYFTDVLVKNPNMPYIAQLMKNEILSVEGVTSAEVEDYSYSSTERTASFSLRFAVGNEAYEKEVKLNV